MIKVPINWDRIKKTESYLIFIPKQKILLILLIVSNLMMKKSILITGASGNIGSIVSKKASNIFDILYLHTFQRIEKLIKLKSELSNDCEVRIFQMDITNNQQLSRKINNLLFSSDKLDALVHCVAKRSTDAVQLVSSNPELWEDVIRVNLIGTYYLLRVLLPFLRKANCSRIVLLGSIVAQIGLPYGSAYAAAKAGISNLVKSIAMEEGKNNILINAILPGPVEIDQSHFSPEYKQFREKYYKEMKEQIPLHRFAQPEEVADLIMFLISDRNRYITGQEIRISGGL